jgi:transcriptional regulator with GAF, ATPase, and Fis domain
MQTLIIRYETQLIRLPLPEAEVSVGSAPSNGIVLPYPGISRTHATLTPTQDGAVLTDCGSKNRLIVNGERADRVQLLPGVSVQIGRAQLSLEEISTDDVAPTYRMRAQPAALAARHQGDTDAISSADDSSRPREALALIRQIESLSPRALTRARNELLQRARSLLGAECVAVFHHGPETELALTGSAGAPSFDLMETIAASSARAKRTHRQSGRVNDSTFFVSTTRAARSMDGIAALLPRRSVAAWEGDLLDYLRMKLTARSTSEESGAIALRSDLNHPKGMVVGSSAAMAGLLANIAATVRSKLDVLLLGETGTGKEVIARMIHESGPTAGAPFVAINCAAIPTELLEAELFGVHGRVATGVDPRQGLFTQAESGSIFLDEIGELPDALQPKLLRVLQEREVLPIGASSPRRINVRVIAASNRDLYERTREGRFRADLFYRLRGLQFHVPPLRDRKEDIPTLALTFAERAAEEYHKEVRGISRSAMQLLMDHDWPGNVRELQSEIARAVLVCFDGGVLQCEHFAPVRFRVDQRDASPPAASGFSVPPAATPRATPDSPLLQDRVDAVERETILEALHRSAGNKSAAAKTLGITRNGLTLKMARLGLA